MRLDRAFLALNLLLILVSVVAHEVAAESAVFLVLTLGVCGVVWVRHRRARPLVLNNAVATVVCAGAFLLMLFRGLSPAALTGGVRLLDVRVPAVGAFLIVFQWVYLLREKEPRDYFWVYLVTVVHMGTAGLLMPGVVYGFFFLLYMLVGVCALAVYYLWTEVRTLGPEVVRETRVGWRLAGAGLPLTLVLMVPVALVFTLLPRKAEGTTIGTQLIRLGMQPVSGFSTTVRLGDVGTIQDNPRRVMHLTVKDPDTGRAVEVPDLLMRGVALDRYIKEENRWYWETTLENEASRRGPWRRFQTSTSADISAMYADDFPEFKTANHRRVQLDVTIEPMRTSYLFAPFAAESVLGLPGEGRMAGNIWTHSLWTHPWSTPMQYSVISRLFTLEPYAGPPTGSVDKKKFAPFLDLPEELSPRVRNLARSIVREGERPSDYLKAVRIFEYLSDDSRFAYTLRMDPAPDVEPVEDFLFNRREGHCEYFASSMVLLCRSAGVPARLINGFRVSEWNPIGGHYVVRQSNAHSWAEVYLHPGGWRTFDPSVMRDAATPKPLIVRRWGRNLYDTAETLWVHHVLNYDAESQSAIYRAINTRIDALRQLWQDAVVEKGAEWLSYDERQLQRILWQLADPLRIGLIAGMVFLTGWLSGLTVRWLLRRWRRRRKAGPAWRFYHRMEHLLARAGFHRRPTQTPWEFHEALAVQGWPEVDAVRTITRAFCDARYGERELSAADMADVARALERLKRARRA